jgi:hypothetical protein
MSKIEYAYFAVGQVNVSFISCGPHPHFSQYPVAHPAVQFPTLQLKPPKELLKIFCRFEAAHYPS